jgi:hypothetical protein
VRFVVGHRRQSAYEVAAVAAGVEYGRWSLEQAVEMTAEYLRRKEDAKFEDAFAKLA